jgi:hypothetical protein
MTMQTLTNLVFRSIAPRDIRHLKAPARLSLLTAFASYQLTDADVAAFRAQHASDAALVGAASWASYRAMRRISGWLHAPATAAKLAA